jgi:CheY-like chemotaxis protein
VTQDFAAAAQARRPAPRRKPTRRGRILIVDDEAKLALTLGMLLEEAHQVERCLQARVALERIRNGPPYDAILCDMMMPEMTGEQLYEAVLATDPEQARRIIFMTGGAFTEGARQFLERVRNPQLTKPFKVEEVESLLASLVG